MGFYSKLKTHLGYFMIDHRESPGISHDEAVRQPGTLPVGRGQMFETDIRTCVHCQATVIMNPLRERPRNWCAKCDAYVCDRPECNIACRPYLQYLDELDRQDKLTVGV